MNCTISLILTYSRRLCTMNKSQIMHAITEETGELATEVAIDLGFKNREPSKDGVVGEAVDVIVSAVDMIYAENPSITVEEIHALVAAKCGKWAYNVERR